MVFVKREVTRYSNPKNFMYSCVQSGWRKIACPCSSVMSPRHTCRHTLASNWS